MTEAELKRLVVDLAHSRGWRVFSLPMVKPLRPVKAADGYPDLTLARDRQVIWIELKQDAGVISPAQLAWMRELPNMVVLRPADWHSGEIGRLLA